MKFFLNSDSELLSSQSSFFLLCVYPDPYSGYGSGSAKLLNSDPFVVVSLSVLSWFIFSLSLWQTWLRWPQQPRPPCTALSGSSAAAWSGRLSYIPPPPPPPKSNSSRLACPLIVFSTDVNLEGFIPDPATTFRVQDSKRIRILPMLFNFKHIGKLSKKLIIDQKEEFTCNNLPFSISH